MTTSTITGKPEKQHLARLPIMRMSWRRRNKSTGASKISIGPGKRLDFSRPFLPETLARVEKLDFLTPEERLILNQIRGHDYLYIFGLVEEFILPFVLDHARPILHGNNARVRAFLNFAGEEAKHIELFKRFREDFLSSFGSNCEVIGPPEADCAGDPFEASSGCCARHSPHRVDDSAPLPRQRADGRGPGSAVQEPADAPLDGRVAARQTGYADGSGDLRSLLPGGTRKFHRRVSRNRRNARCRPDAAGEIRPRKSETQDRTGIHAGKTRQFFEVQQQANRWTFLGTGMSHKNFLATVELVKPGAAAQLEQIVPMFC